MKKRVIGVGLVFFLLLFLMSSFVFAAEGTCVIPSDDSASCLQIFNSDVPEGSTPEEICSNYYDSTFVVDWFFQDQETQIRAGASENVDLDLINGSCYGDCCKIFSEDDVCGFADNDMSYFACQNKFTELGLFTYSFKENDYCVCDEIVERTISGSLSFGTVVPIVARPEQVVVTLNKLGLQVVASKSEGYSFLFNAGVSPGMYSLSASAGSFSGGLPSINVYDENKYDQIIPMTLASEGAILVIVRNKLLEPFEDATAIWSYGEGESSQCVTNSSGECWMEVPVGDDPTRNVIVGAWGFGYEVQEVTISSEDGNVAIVEVYLEEQTEGTVLGNVHFNNALPDSFDVFMEYPYEYVLVGAPLDGFVDTFDTTPGISGFNFDSVYVSDDEPLLLKVSVSATNYDSNYTEFEIVSSDLSDGSYMLPEAIQMFSGPTCGVTPENSCVVPMTGWYCNDALELVRDCRSLDGVEGTVDDCCSPGYTCQSQGPDSQGLDIYTCVSASESAVCEADCTFIGDDTCHAACDGWENEFTGDTCNFFSEELKDYFDGETIGLHSFNESHNVQACEGSFIAKADTPSTEICDDMEGYGNAYFPLDNDDNGLANCQEVSCQGKSCTYNTSVGGVSRLFPGICFGRWVEDNYVGECEQDCQFRNCEGDVDGTRLDSEHPGEVYGNLEGPCMCGNRPLNYLGTSSLSYIKGPYCLAGAVVDGVQGFVTDDYAECLSKIDDRPCLQEGYACCSNGCDDSSILISELFFEEYALIPPETSCGEETNDVCCDGGCKASLPAAQCCSDPLMCQDSDYATAHQGEEGCSAESYACTSECILSYPECDVDAKEMTKANGDMYWETGDDVSPFDGYIDAVDFSSNGGDTACYCGEQLFPTSSPTVGACCPSENRESTYPVFLQNGDGEYECAQYVETILIEGDIRLVDASGVFETLLFESKAIFTNIDSGLSFVAFADNGRYEIGLSVGKYSVVPFKAGYMPFNNEVVYVEVFENGNYYLATYDEGIWQVSGSAQNDEQLDLDITIKQFECDYDSAPGGFNGSHIKGVKAVKLNWTPPCYGFPVAYYKLVRQRLDGDTFVDDADVNVPISKVSQISPNQFFFIDDGGVLGLPAPAWDTTYNYILTVVYIQTNGELGAVPGSESGTATTQFTTGNAECEGKTLIDIENQQFCVGQIREVCLDNNHLASDGVTGQDYLNSPQGSVDLNRDGEFEADEHLFDDLYTPNCLTLEGDYICISSAGKAYCRLRGECATPGSNVFGLFSYEDACLGVPVGEFDGTNAEKYCYFDYSHSTKDDCFSCRKQENKKIMDDENNEYYYHSAGIDSLDTVTCYDYKSERGCEFDTCGAAYVDDGAADVRCKWYNTSSKEFGSGVCYPANPDNVEYSYTKNSDEFDDWYGYRSRGIGTTNDEKGPSTCNLCDGRLNPFANINCTQNVCDKLGDCYSEIDPMTQSGNSDKYVTACDLENDYAYCDEQKVKLDACKCEAVYHLFERIFDRWRDESGEYNLQSNYNDLHEFIGFIDDQIDNAFDCSNYSYYWVVGIDADSSDEPYTSHIPTDYFLRAQCQLNKVVLGDYLDACSTLAEDGFFVEPFEDFNYLDSLVSTCGYAPDFEWNSASEEYYDDFYSNITNDINLISADFDSTPYMLSYCTSCKDAHGMCDSYMTQKSCEGVDHLALNYTNATYVDTLPLPFPVEEDAPSVYSYEFEGTSGPYYEGDVEVQLELLNTSCQLASDYLNDETEFPPEVVADVVQALYYLDANKSLRNSINVLLPDVAENLTIQAGLLTSAELWNKTCWDRGGNYSVVEQKNSTNNTKYQELQNFLTMYSAPYPDGYWADLAEHELAAQTANDDLIDAWEYHINTYSAANLNLTNVRSNHTEAFNLKTDLVAKLADANNNITYILNDYIPDLEPHDIVKNYITAYDNNKTKCENYEATLSFSDDAQGGVLVFVPKPDDTVKITTSFEASGMHTYNISFLAKSSINLTTMYVTLNGRLASIVTIQNTSKLQLYEVHPILTAFDDPAESGDVNLSLFFQRQLTHLTNPEVKLSSVKIRSSVRQGLRFPSDDACGLSACDWNEDFGFCFKDGNDDDLPDCYVPDEAKGVLESNLDKTPGLSGWSSCNKNNTPPTVIDNIVNATVGRNGLDISFYSIDPVHLESKDKRTIVEGIEEDSELADGIPVKKLWFCIDRMDACDPFEYKDYNLNGDEDPGDNSIDLGLSTSFGYSYKMGDHSKNLIEAYIAYKEYIEGSSFSLEDSGPYYLRYAAMDQYYNMMPIRSSSMFIDMVPPTPKLTFLNSEDQRVIKSSNISLMIYSEVPGDTFYCSLNITNPDLTPGNPPYAVGLDPDNEDGKDKINGEGLYVNAFSGLNEGYHKLALHCWDDADNHNTTYYVVYIDAVSNINLTFPQPSHVISGKDVTDFWVVLTTKGNSTCNYRGTPFHEMHTDQQLEAEGLYYYADKVSFVSSFGNGDVSHYLGAGEYKAIDFDNPVTGAPISVADLENDVNIEDGGYVHMMHSSMFNKLINQDDLNAGYGFVAKSRYYPAQGESGLDDIFCVDQETSKTDSVRLVFTYDKSAPISTLTVDPDAYSVSNPNAPEITLNGKIYVDNLADNKIIFNCEDRNITNIDGSISAPENSENNDIGNVMGCDTEGMVLKFDSDQYPASRCTDYYSVGKDLTWGMFDSETELEEYVVSDTTVFLFKSVDFGGNEERFACLEVMFDEDLPTMTIVHSFAMDDWRYDLIDITNMSKFSVKFEINEPNPYTFNATLTHPDGSGVVPLFDEIDLPSNPLNLAYEKIDLPLKEGEFENLVYARLEDDVGRVNESELYIFYDQNAPVIDDLIVRDITHEDYADDFVCSMGEDGFGRICPQDKIEYGHPFEIIVFVDDVNFTSLPYFLENNTVYAGFKDMMSLQYGGYKVNESVCSDVYEDNYCSEDCVEEICTISCVWLNSTGENACDELGCFDGEELEGYEDTRYEVCYNKTTSWTPVVEYTGDLVEIEYVTNDLYLDGGLSYEEEEYAFVLRPTLLELSSSEDEIYTLDNVKAPMYEPVFKKYIYDFPWKAGEHIVEVKAVDILGNPTTPNSEALNTVQRFTVVDSVEASIAMGIREHATQLVVEDSLTTDYTYDVTFIADEYIMTDMENPNGDCVPRYELSPTPADPTYERNLNCFDNKCTLTIDNVKKLFGANVNEIYGYEFKGCDINERPFISSSLTFNVDTRGRSDDIPLPWIRAKDSSGNALPPYPANGVEYEIYSLSEQIELIGYIADYEGLKLEVRIQNNSGGPLHMFADVPSVALTPQPELCTETTLNVAAESLQGVYPGDGILSNDVESIFFGIENTADVPGLLNDKLAISDCYVRFSDEHIMNNFWRYSVLDSLLYFGEDEYYAHLEYGLDGADDANGFSVMTLNDPLKQPIQTEETFNLYQSKYPENWFNFSEVLPYADDINNMSIIVWLDGTPSYNSMNLVVKVVDDTYAPEVLDPVLYDLSGSPPETCEEGICEKLEYGHAFEILISVNDSEYTFFFEQDNTVLAKLKSLAGKYFVGNQTHYAELDSVFSDHLGISYFEPESMFRLRLNESYLTHNDEGDEYILVPYESKSLSMFDIFATKYPMAPGEYTIEVFANDSLGNEMTTELSFEIEDTVAPEFMFELNSTDEDFDYTAEDAVAESGYEFNLAIFANDFIINDSDDENAPSLTVQGVSSFVEPNDLSDYLVCNDTFCVFNDLLTALGKEVTGVLTFTFEACDLNRICGTDSFDLQVDTAELNSDIPLPWFKGDQTNDDPMPRSEDLVMGQHYFMKAIGDNVTLVGILPTSDDGLRLTIEMQHPPYTLFEINLSSAPESCGPAEDYQIANSVIASGVVFDLGAGSGEVPLEGIDDQTLTLNSDCKYAKFGDHHPLNDFNHYQFSFGGKNDLSHTSAIKDGLIGYYYVVDLVESLMHPVETQDYVEFYRNESPQNRFSKLVDLWTQGNNGWVVKVWNGDQFNFMILEVNNIPENNPPVIDDFFLVDTATELSCSPAYGCGTQIEWGHSFDVVVLINDTDYKSLITPDQTVNMTVFYPNGSVFIEEEITESISSISSGSDDYPDLSFDSEYAFANTVSVTSSILGSYGEYTFTNYSLPVGTYAVEIIATDVFGVSTTEYLEFNIVDTVAPEFEIKVFDGTKELDFEMGDELKLKPYKIVVTSTNALVDPESAMLSISGEGVDFSLSSGELSCENNVCEAWFAAIPPQVPHNTFGELELFFEASDVNGAFGSASLMINIDTMGYDSSLPLPWIKGVPRDENDEYTGDFEFPLIVVQKDNVTLTGFLPTDMIEYSYQIWVSKPDGAPSNVTDIISLNEGALACGSQSMGNYNVSGKNIGGMILSHSAGSTKFGVESIMNLSESEFADCTVRFGEYGHEENGWLNYPVGDINYFKHPNYNHELFDDTDFFVDYFSAITLAKSLAEEIFTKQGVFFRTAKQPHNWFNVTVDLPYDTTIVSIWIWKTGTDSYKFLDLEVFQVGEFGQYRIDNIVPDFDETFSFTSGIGNFETTIEFEVPLLSDCSLIHLADTTAEAFEIEIETEPVQAENGWFKYSYTITPDMCGPGGPFYQMGTKKEDTLSLKNNFHNFLIECTHPWLGSAVGPVCYKFDTLISQYDSISQTYTFTGLEDVCEANSPGGLPIITKCERDCSTTYFDYDGCIGDAACKWCPGSVVDGYKGMIEGGSCVNWNAGQCEDCEVNGVELKYDNRPSNIFVGGKADEGNKICDNVGTCNTDCGGHNVAAGCKCPTNCRISASGGLYVPPTNGNVDCGGPLACATDFPTVDYYSEAEYNVDKRFRIDVYDDPAQAGAVQRDDEYPGFDDYGTQGSFGYYMRQKGVDPRCELCESGGARYYVNDCGSCSDNPYNNDHKLNDWTEGPPGKNKRNKICDDVPMCPGTGNSVECSGYETTECRCHDSNTRFTGYLIAHDDHVPLADTPSNAQYSGPLVNCGGYSESYANSQGKTNCGTGTDDCTMC
ncbi:hypothetical protein HN419_01925 [Candidatus Woesearchaeota archaeon]|nr:hypothetical protein [Candidatus Woesearchaeota archaeon]MBT3537245.1 hypothetical protein [Candidatus Woesearchaeota archaeon]MBT7106445.1 hypothetical protein [Candidatus Woesearchaeota archaeon]MBT7931180.1 hypothetical protein [Candidatus Woesearchaeota archaeon]